MHSEIRNQTRFRNQPYPPSRSQAASSTLELTLRPSRVSSLNVPAVRADMLQILYA